MSLAETSSNTREGWRGLKLIDTLDQSNLAKKTPVAESDQFAIFAIGEDTYMLVQRHASTPWEGVTFSGDALFRVGSLMVEAMRDVYRDVASNLSPNHRSGKANEVR